ncbi:MAG: glycosyltransferase family 1 protein [Rhodospirillales bacterium]|nr:glycosyltransferase family 1 protein [Rhodospirillales bacterium]
MNRTAEGADIVLLIKGQSQYDTMRELTADIAVAFRQRGLQVVEIDGMAPGAGALLEALMSGGRVAFVYGMNGWGLGASLNLNRLCDDAGVPYVGHLFDHPLTYAKRLFDAPRNAVWCLHDSTYVRFVDEDLALPGAKAVVPVGGPVADPAATPLPVDARDIAILFPGSGYSSTTATKPWSTASAAERKVMDAIYDLALYDTGRPLHDTIRQVLRLYSGVAVDWRADWIARIFTMLDNQLRVERRVEVVKALAELPIQVYGHGWDNLAAKGGGARFHAPVGFRETQALMGRAKVVLNVLPCVVDAPHDRIFYSTMAGAVSLTDRNRWVERHYAEGGELAIYDLPPRDLGAAVAEFLADRDSLERIAAAGRARTAEDHTWLNRVDAILDAVAAQRLAYAA